MQPDSALEVSPVRRQFVLLLGHFSDENCVSRAMVTEPKGAITA
jgi:hypothetical protein